MSEAFASACDPATAAALHARGCECAVDGEHLLAAEAFGRAAALRPSIPAFHVDLAEAFRNLGDATRAVGCCRIALMLRPDDPDALNTLGLALRESGWGDGAVGAFRRALELRPDSVALHNNLGTALCELGRTDEAVAEFRQAAGLGPGLFRVQTNLGLSLLDQGRAEEALAPLREAVRLRPDMPILHHNLARALRALDLEDEATAAGRNAIRLDPDAIPLSPCPRSEPIRTAEPSGDGDPRGQALLNLALGDSMRAQGRHVDSRAAYLEALRLDIGRVSIYLRIGISLRQEHLFDDARPWIEKAVALDPENSSYWEQLAKLHGERDEPGEAVRCWRRVLALSPAKTMQMYVSLGWALQEEGRLPEALEHYRNAARLEPGSAQAQLHIGGAQAEAGRMAEAEAAFREALRLQPQSAQPHARLAMLLRDKLPDAERAVIEDLLADPGLEPGPRARLLFGLAHVLDASGNFDRAADCLRRANALDMAEAQGPLAYDPGEHTRFVDGLLHAFDAGSCARFAGLGSSTRRPVFVLGLPRSGTTLIEQILASHPRVHGAGELRLGRVSFRSIPASLGHPEYGQIPPIQCVSKLDARSLRCLAERHLEQLALHDGGQANRVVDKMPDNYLFLGLLSAMFPAATFIHCRRDPRDVALSCWMTDFRTIRWANDPGHIANHFREYRRLMAHWRAVLPATVHNVDYEETVADLEAVARRLLDACGLEWDPACLEFHRTQRTVRTASLSQVRRPLYKTSLARWKNYERSLAELFEALPSDETGSGWRRTSQ